MVNFSFKSWMLGIIGYFFIYDNMHISPIYQLKGGVGKTLESLNPLRIGGIYVR